MRSFTFSEFRSKARRSIERFVTGVIVAIFATSLLQSQAVGPTQFSFPNIDSLYGPVRAGYGVNPNAPDPGDIILGLGVRFNISTNGPINTGGFTYNVQFIKDSSDVFTFQSASAQAEAKYLMFSAKASYATSIASHKTSDSIMWAVVADKDYGVREQVTGVELTDVAKARLNEGYDAFVRQFGTRFISSWSRKAHLAIIFEAYNLQQQDEQHVNAMFSASAQYAGGSASAGATMKSEFRSLSSTARTRVSFFADGISVDQYFAGATDLTALDQIQAGVIRLLADIEKQNGNVAQYYTTPFSDVIANIQPTPPFPEFPELDKAQRAFLQAYVAKLQIEAFRNGPRGPYLEAKELDYLTRKTAECVERLAQIDAWLKRFKSDSTLKARAWIPIDLKLPELLWYAAQPFPASGPSGQYPVMSVFVGGGSEVGAVSWSNGNDLGADIPSGYAPVGIATR